MKKPTCIWMDLGPDDRILRGDEVRLNGWVPVSTSIGYKVKNWPYRFRRPLTVTQAAKRLHKRVEPEIKRKGK